jgi:hypothetical protein
MSKLEKIKKELRFIQEYDGTELSEAAFGLSTWLKYGYDGEDLLDVLAVPVYDMYVGLKEEMEEETQSPYEVVLVSELPKSSVCLFRILGTNIVLTKCAGHIFDSKGEDFKMGEETLCEVIRVI